MDSLIEKHVIEGAKLYPGQIKEWGRFTPAILPLPGGKCTPGIAGGVMNEYERSSTGF